MIQKLTFALILILNFSLFCETCNIRFENSPDQIEFSFPSSWKYADEDDFPECNVQIEKPKNHRKCWVFTGEVPSLKNNERMEYLFAVNHCLMDIVYSNHKIEPRGRCVA